MAVAQGANNVVNVISGSPAETAGIQTGDIIYKIDGNPVGTDTSALSKLISGKKTGDTISLEIWRGGQTSTISVTLAESAQ